MVHVADFLFFKNVKNLDVQINLFIDDLQKNILLRNSLRKFSENLSSKFSTNAKNMFESSHRMLRLFVAAATATEQAATVNRSIPTGGTTTANTDCNNRHLQQDHSQAALHVPEVLSPTGNPLLDVLSLFLLTKLSQVNHYLSKTKLVNKDKKTKEAKHYSHPATLFIHLLQ